MIDIEQLFKNIDKLKNQYSFDIYNQDAGAKEKIARDAIIKYRASENEGVKMLLSELDKLVMDITYKLAWDKDLPEEERKKLFERRAAYVYVISFFKGAEETLESIFKYTEEELKNLS